MRSDRQLHQVPVAYWTTEEGLAHLAGTFDLAVDARPDLFEDYLSAIGEAASDDDAQIKLMRRALRETFAARWPNRFEKRPASEAPAGQGDLFS